jgi:hypothetical protein
MSIDRVLHHQYGLGRYASWSDAVWNVPRPPQWYPFASIASANSAAFVAYRTLRGVPPP